MRLPKRLKHSILELFQFFYDPYTKKENFLGIFGPITSSKEIKKRDFTEKSEQTNS